MKEKVVRFFSNLKGKINKKSIIIILIILFFTVKKIKILAFSLLIYLAFWVLWVIDKVVWSFELIF